MRKLFFPMGRMIKGSAEKVTASNPYATVELFHWEAKNGARNFGDHLSQVIVDAAALNGGYTLNDEVLGPRRLLAIGSILHFAQDGDVIWGSGINGKIALDRVTVRRLDVRAVRGPKTATILRNLGIEVPEVFGDPALLVPSFFSSRFRVTPSQDYIVIPNLHDLHLVPDSERRVSPLMGWNKVVERIVKAKFVVASSLHGIILAEAFGVPARYVRFSQTEAQFKYDDYAQGTGRSELIPAHSIEHALDLGSHPPIAFDRQALLAAFPYDLWSNSPLAPQSEL